MKHAAFAAAAVATLALAGAAAADPYVDYTPDKGLWHVQSIHVDPNHIDDYVVGIKATWVPGEEVAKKHGIIDSYQVMVKLNSGGDDANVLLVEHLTSAATLDPDKARDMAMDKEVSAAAPKAAMQAKVKDFEKYRTFVKDEYYGSLTYIK
jgi:hypothetical protein